MINLLFIMATLFAKEHQRATGGFSEHKYESTHPQTHTKPAAGKPFSENRSQESQPAIPQPSQQKTLPPATPSTPTATPAEISQTLQQTHPQMSNWFAPNLWAGANWARASQWASLASPIYYDSNGTTILPSNPTQTTDAAAEPVDNWMPLGIFAIGTQEVEPIKATTFLQLAIDNQGQVSGTYYDSTTKQTFPIKGNYNKSTQAITWKITGIPDSPIMQTGLYNLTEDQTPIKVILPDTSRETWSLVKIKKPTN